MKIISAQVYDSVCQTEGAVGAPVYGVQVRFASGETVFCPDLNANKEVAKRLCDQLSGSDMDSDTLWDIFADFAVIAD